MGNKKTINDLHEDALTQIKEIYGVRALARGELITTLSDDNRKIYLDIAWIAFLSSYTTRLIIAVFHTNAETLGVILPIPQQDLWKMRLLRMGNHKPIILDDWDDPVYKQLQTINLVSSKGGTRAYDGDNLSLTLQIVGACTMSEIFISPNPQEESLNKLYLSILDSALTIAQIAKLSSIKSKIEKMPKPILLDF